MHILKTILKLFMFWKCILIIIVQIVKLLLFFSIDIWSHDKIWSKVYACEENNLFSISFYIKVTSLCWHLKIYVNNTQVHASGYTKKYFIIISGRMTNNCHFPHMRFETRRFGSFSVYETTIDCFNLWPTRLAINGYFWNFQSIVCFFCSSHYPDHTSTCNNDREQYNIPFHLCAEVIEEQDLQNLSTCIMLRSGVFLSILLERAPQNLHSQLISLHSQSSNFNFQNFYERLNSLRPLSRTISDISILAQAGFYAGICSIFNNTCKC